MDATESNHSSPMPDINETFIADRQMFWSRFTTFTMGAVVAVTVLLVGLLIFVA